jgi:Zn-dependent peptidase ImmA (M78 family)
MNFPMSARYASVMVRVNDFFIKEQITTFPIDPFQIIKNNKWGLISYTELASEYGVWIEDIIATVQSEDGYTMYDGVNYTIAYNDTKNKARIRFTLMHEIGHIFLRHLVDFEETILTRSTLTEKKYRVLENEANSFARNTLAPVMVVRNLSIKTVQNLIESFGLSKAAAETRLNSLIMDYQWLGSPFIRFQRLHFNQYIRFCNHSNQCLICSHHFIHEKADYCSVCGHGALLNRKGVDEMIYKGYLLDDNSRAIVCPSCENEHIDYEGNWCKICNAYLVNECAPTWKTTNGWNEEHPPCGEKLDGDARYCVKCGNESTFYQGGLLKDWKTEKEEIERDERVRKILEEEPLPF